MQITNYTQLDTWQLCDAFDREVTRIVAASPQALSDLRFKGQILDACGGPSTHVAEGYLRKAPLEFCRFLRYALGSIAETERWLHRGIRRGYFGIEECQSAFVLAKRCTAAAARLRDSQELYAQQQEEHRALERRARLRSRSARRTRSTRRT